MAKKSFISRMKRGPLAAIVSRGKSLIRHDNKGPGDVTLKEVNYNYHKMSLDELSAEFQTSCTQGLTEEQASELLIKHGPNILKPPETHHFRKILGIEKII